MRLTSSSFGPGGAIPALFTCEGQDISPEFDWTDAPRETKSFALIIQPRTPKIASLGIQGKNDAGKIGYIGPCPPSGTHRYFVRLFALRTELGLGPGATRDELEDAIEGHAIEEAELMGTYTKAHTRAAR